MGGRPSDGAPVLWLGLNRDARTGAPGAPDFLGKPHWSPLECHLADPGPAGPRALQTLSASVPVTGGLLHPPSGGPKPSAGDRGALAPKQEIQFKVTFKSP